MSQAWQTHGRSTRDKKRRKARKVVRPQERTPVQRPETGSAPVRQQTDGPHSASASVTWKSASTSRSSSGLAIRPEDYTYVYSDLRRIAVLAVGLLAVLLALTFVIK